MSGAWEPRIPKYDKVYCVICLEQVTAPPFVASKPRKGSIIYAHTACFEKEQKEWKEEHARDDRPGERD